MSDAGYQARVDEFIHRFGAPSDDLASKLEVALAAARARAKFRMGLEWSGHV